MCQPLIDYLTERRILILGFGREGRTTYNYIRKYLPDKKIGIADMTQVSFNDPNVSFYCGVNYLLSIADYDLIIKSPGIAFNDVVLPQHIEITCQADLFLRFAPCVSIGITGTKGKTTTTQLVFDMLRSAEIPCEMIGNMGIPVLDELDNIEGKTAVIELSSHQLEFTKSSPHIAVLTNIYPEHLDHYNGFKGYCSAKLNIMRFQSGDDYFISNADQPVSEFLDGEQLRARHIEISAGETDIFYRSLDGINERLCGRHNRQNIFFAAQAAKLCGAENEAIKKAVLGFKGIEHRMEPVGVFKNIKFYNDCIATIPVAVMNAVDALGDVDTLIFGGMDRGIDYSGFEASLRRSKIKNLIALPDTGHQTAQNLIDGGCRKKIIFANNMEEAVFQAFALTASGKSCLLSPAASSYNVYKDFEEKGRHFKELVVQFGSGYEN